MTEKNKILTANNFYDVIKYELFIGEDTESELKKEFETNRVALYLSDKEKDLLSIEDLITYLHVVLRSKKEEIFKKKISKHIIFRLYHDETDNWLRYYFISKNHQEVIASRKRTDDLVFVNDMRHVVESFLDMRDKGYYKTNKFGVKNFHQYSPLDEPPPWKIYEEEIIPTNLQIVK